MCNLYSITKNQAAIRDLFKVGRDTSGNLPPLPAVFPDQMAPVVRVNEGERGLAMTRWGMPNPPQYPDITTNIRNTGRRQPTPRGRRKLLAGTDDTLTERTCGHGFESRSMELRQFMNSPDQETILQGGG